MVFSLVESDKAIASERSWIRSEWLTRCIRECQIVAGEIATDPSAPNAVLGEVLRRVELPGSALEQLVLDGLLFRTTRGCLQTPTRPVLAPIRCCPTQPTSSDDGLELVIRACAFLDGHHQERISESLLARMLGSSTKAIRKAFIRHRGLTPAEELRLVRFRRAVELLSHSDVKVEAVAAMVGFRSKATIYRLFRRTLGKPPGSLRGAEYR